MARPLNTNIPAFNLAISTLLRNPSLMMPNLTIPTFLQLPDHLDSHLHPPSSTATSPHHSSSSSSSSSSAFSTTSSQSKPRQQNPRRKIRALVLDKDNTLTPPHALTIPPAYFEKLRALRTDPASPFNLHDNPHGVLVVSNTAGSDPHYPLHEVEARYLEARLFPLRVPVFRAPRAHAPSLAEAVRHDEQQQQQQQQQQGGRPEKQQKQQQQQRERQDSDTSSSSSSDGSGRRRSGPYLRKPFSHASILAHFQSHGVVSSADEVAVVGDRLATDVLMAGLMGAWSVWVRDGVTVGTEGEDSGKEGLDYRGVLAKAEGTLERYLKRRGVKAAVPDGWES